MMSTCLETLITHRPRADYELANTLSRKGVGYIHPDAEIKK